MSKFLAALAIVIVTFFAALAQDQTQDPRNPPSRGLAPKVENGIGRADVRVVDENGNPIRNAYVKLESTRSDGYFCESWGDTDENGIIVLPPIHMGSLKFKVKAEGYEKAVLNFEASGLGEPVKITLHKK